MHHLTLSLASALAFATMATPVAAQMNMPGMPGMKMPAAKKTPTRKKMAKKPVARASAMKKTGKETVAKPSTNRGMSAILRTQKPSGETMPGMAMPKASQPAPGTQTMPPIDHSPTDQMPGMEMAPAGHMEHMAMTGALGSYPMERESSGTAWQPDTTEHQGLMKSSDDWMLMAHGVLNLVYDHQSGPRGDDKAFASGMLMGMAQRPLGNGTLQFKAMVSPDPLMGPRGYPLLLASGETANGHDRLIDRQHPHDFFMELSGSLSQNLGPKDSAFVYAGLPGEPAFGPPAFMHREAIMASPGAPITHHWLDSTHISFGVLTGGIVLDRVKLEVSRFNGREPDQHRWNIETGPLDSTAIRLSWNPTRTLALQGSWGYFVDPEQLEPGIDQTRWSASALWADDVASGWHAAATLAWGRKSSQGHNDDAFAAEVSLKHSGWTVFGRGELIENRELIRGTDEPAYRVGKVSLGAVRDFRIADHLSFGAGTLFALNFVPDPLKRLYGSSNPSGAMGFVRLKLN